MNDELTWERKGKLWMQSACGRFNIAKNLIRDKAFYVLWMVEVKPPVRIGQFPNFEGAKCRAQEWADDGR